MPCEDLFDRLPFSGIGRSSELRVLGEELIDVLGLKGKLNITETNASGALCMEAHFRRRWWGGESDPFRDAVHALKRRVLKEDNRRAAVTKAWRQMREHVHSSCWRARIQELSANAAPAHTRYLRLAFGASQQLWTRAARWAAAFPAEPNPLNLLIGFYEYSCWPVGWENGSLQVCRCERALDDDEESPRVREARASSGWTGEKIVFVSAPFRARSTANVIRTIMQNGWTTLHGPVDENSSPEPQLGAKIRSAAATVGYLAAIDRDFGIPWWMFQEIDFAQACDRPAALVLSRVPRERDRDRDLPLFTMKNEKFEDRFWEWLKCSAQTR